MGASLEPSLKSIDLLIKPTLDCNAKCIYCHSLKPLNRMSLELVETIFQKWASYASKEGIEQLSINWHGGEPMIMGASFYRGVLDLERKYFPNTKISHAMQSNACLYKGEVRDVVLDLVSDRSIGACLDPCHPTRLLPTGKDYYEQSVQGCLSLIDDGFGVNMIYVVHKRSLEVVEKVYYFFKNLGVRNVLFHPLEDFQGPDYRLTSEDWGEFLRKLWTVWEDDDFALTIFPLSDWRGRIVFGEPVESCEHGLPRENQLHLVISPVGDLYPCHRFQDKDLCRIGNIESMTFDEVVQHPWANLLSESKKNLGEICSACEFVGLCRAGCVATRQPNAPTLWCPGLKDFFGFLKDRGLLDNMPAELTECDEKRCPHHGCQCE
ncbi:MAG: radical SAM protein [Desulfomonile tiedjei]|nr:radical SAM protein [Desulfomonile tiedjei]